MMSETLKQMLLNDGALDPEGVHHVFASGLHGQKLDFGVIDPDGSTYDRWVSDTVDTIRRRYQGDVSAIMGIANGTTQLAEDVADELSADLIPTRKHENDPRQVVVDSEYASRVARLGNGLLVVLDDVGTTGSVALSGIDSVRRLLAPHTTPDIEVLYGWQRQSTPLRLQEAGIHYHALIYNPLPTYTPPDCRQIGFCGKRWGLVPYGE